MKVFKCLRQFDFEESFEGLIRKITKENKRLQKTYGPGALLMSGIIPLPHQTRPVW